MFHLLANSYNYFNGFSGAYGGAQGPGSISTISVSYTHLDVYKRQLYTVLNAGGSMLSAMPSLVM